jgi:hypothetical protein
LTTVSSAPAQSQPYVFVFMGLLTVVFSFSRTRAGHFLGLMIPGHAPPASDRYACSLDAGAALSAHASTCYILRGRSTFSPSETLSALARQWARSDRLLKSSSHRSPPSAARRDRPTLVNEASRGVRLRDASSASAIAHLRHKSQASLSQCGYSHRLNEGPPWTSAHSTGEAVGLRSVARGVRQ